MRSPSRAKTWAAPLGRPILLVSRFRKHNVGGFSVPRKYRVAPARLIAFGSAMRCSICMMPFPPDAKPSRVAAFAEHVLKDHHPIKTNDDVNPKPIDKQTH